VRCKIISVGTKPPAWVSIAVQDYEQRLPSEFKLSWVEVKAAQRGASSNATRWMQQEAQSIQAVLPERCHLVILDEHGKDLTTRALAARMQTWRESALETVILVGGPDGLAPEIKALGKESIRLSSLTLPHALVRVLLIEQLFRAWSVLHNHPYHRD
jgi:23S rRNA (pseudouridine1915-N3)-methyltransferase